MSISPPPSGPLNQIGKDGLSIDEIATAYKLIQSALAGAAVAGAEDAAVVGAGEAVGTMTALAGGLIAAIVIAIVALLFALVILIHNTIRKQVSNIPFVGGQLATILDALYQTVEGVITWIDNELTSLWDGILLDFHKLISLLLGLFGLNSTAHIATAVQKHAAVLARLPYDVDALENRVMKALSQTLASIWTNVSELWHWIHVLLNDVNMIWNALHQIWSWIHHLLYVTAVLTQLIHWLQGEVHKLWHNITGLWNAVSSLQHRVSTLENEIVALQHRVITLESNVVPAMETLAVLSLLLPLAYAGESGVNNLEKLAKDPCHCFSIPGSKGYMLYALTMYLWLRDGP